MKSKLLFTVFMAIVLAGPILSQVPQGGDHQAVAGGNEYVAIY